MAQLLKMLDFCNERVGNIPTRNMLIASAAAPVVLGLAYKLVGFQKRQDLRKRRQQYATDMKLETKQLAERCKNKVGHTQNTGSAVW